MDIQYLQVYLNSIFAQILCVPLCGSDLLCFDFRRYLRFLLLVQSLLQFVWCADCLVSDWIQNVKRIEKNPEEKCYLFFENSNFRALEILGIFFLCLKYSNFLAFIIILNCRVLGVLLLLKNLNFRALFSCSELTRFSTFQSS